MMIDLKTKNAPPVRVQPAVRRLARIVARTIEGTIIIGGISALGLILYLAILGIVSQWATIRELALPAITILSLWVLYRVARHYEDA